jgi:chromosome partitioning protein
MIEIMDHIDKALNRTTERWIALTRFTERRKLAQEVKEKLLEYFPSRVLATPIREIVALAESPGFGQTIFEYQKKGRGAEDYMKLAQDLLNRRVM